MERYASLHTRNIHLEHCGVLNPLSERDLFALHYGYLPRINESITTFADSLNHHGLRTAHNDSPLQLYTTGYLQLRHMDVPALDFLHDVNDEYGVSEEGMPQGNQMIRKSSQKHHLCLISNKRNNWWLPLIQWIQVQTIE